MLLFILQVMLLYNQYQHDLCHGRADLEYNSTSSPVILLREHRDTMQLCDRCHNPNAANTTGTYTNRCNLSRVTFIFELTVSGGAPWRRGAVQTNHLGSSLFWRAYRFGPDCLTDGAASSRNGSSNTRSVRKSYGPIW